MEMIAVSHRFESPENPPFREFSVRLMVDLRQPAQQVVALLSGINVRFVPDANERGNDRWLGMLKVQLHIDNNPMDGWSPGGMRVPVRVTYLLRDWSGDIDDKFDGTIDFVVLAE